MQITWVTSLPMNKTDNLALKAMSLATIRITPKVIVTRSKQATTIEDAFLKYITIKKMVQLSKLLIEMKKMNKDLLR